MSASVLRLAMTRAKLPASETLPPPEPELASASKLSVLPAGVVASASSEEAVSVLPAGSETRLVRLVRSTATPAPMPRELASVELPSAVALESACAELFRLAAPLATTMMAPSRPAWAETLAISTLTEAAAETLPAEVLAEGVVVGPESLPPPLVAWLSALERSPETAPSTPPEGALLSSAAGAPPAEAFELAALVESPVAERLRAAMPLRLRAMVACTEWLAIVTATAMPTPAVVAPEAVAPALELTLAVWVAVAVRLPAMLVSAPVPMLALVVTLESETATEGVMSTEPR